MAKQSTPGKRKGHTVRDLASGRGAERARGAVVGGKQAADERLTSAKDKTSGGFLGGMLGILVSITTTGQS